MELLIKDIENIIKFIDNKENKLFKNKNELIKLKFVLYQLLCFYKRISNLPTEYKNIMNEIYNEVFKLECENTNISYNKIQKFDYVNMIDKIKNKFDTFNEIYITEIENLENKFTYSFNDCIDITKDFFISFDKKYYNDILPFLNKNYIMNCKSEAIGESIYNSYSNNIFINIDNKYSIKFIIILIHELGHSIQFLNNNNYIKSTYSIYSEFPSQFFEFQFLKYLKNNYFNDDADILINSYLKKLIVHTYNFDYIINRTYNNIEKMYNCITTFSYILGNLLSLYYSKLYDIDKDKTKKELDIIFKNIGVKENKIISNDDFYNFDFLEEEILDNQKNLTKKIRKF